MKVNNLFLVGVAALSLGMTACNNEDVPQVNNPGEGTTFAGMYISAMKDVSTRAVNDNQEDYGGRTEESTLESLRLISPGTPQDWTRRINSGRRHRSALTKSLHGKPLRVPKQWRCCLIGALLIPVLQRP